MCTRLTYGVQFATDIFQETMSLELLEFLEKWLMIYVDNFLLSMITKSEHLVALKQLSKGYENSTLSVERRNANSW